MIHKKIKLDIYEREILFVCGDETDCKKFLEKRFSGDFDTSVYGFCGSNGNVLIIYINLTDTSDINKIVSTMSHEIFHAVLSLYDSIENAMSPDCNELVFHRHNTEPYAYVCGYITEKMYTYIMQYIKEKESKHEITTTTEE